MKEKNILMVSQFISIGASNKKLVINCNNKDHKLIYKHEGLVMSILYLDGQLSWVENGGSMQGLDAPLGARMEDLPSWNNAFFYTVYLKE